MQLLSWRACSGGSATCAFTHKRADKFPSEPALFEPVPSPREARQVFGSPFTRHDAREVLVDTRTSGTIGLRKGSPTHRWWKIDRAGWTEREHVPSGMEAQTGYDSDVERGCRSNRVVFACEGWIRTAEMLALGRMRHPEIIERLPPAGCGKWKQHDTGILKENCRGTLYVLEDDTDCVGTSGHQRELCKHVHENAHLHTAPVSLLTIVHVGCEPQQHFTGCSQC